MEQPEHNSNNVESIKAVLGSASKDGERLILLNKLAYMLIDVNPEESFAFAERAVALGERLEARQHLYQSYHVIGKYYFKKEDYSKALMAFEKELEIGTKLGDKQDISKSLADLGLVLFNLGNYPEAIRRFEEALPLEEQFDNKPSILALLNNLGVLYKRLGRYEMAKSRLLQALNLTREIKDVKTETRIINNLGNIYQNKGEYEKAIQSYLQALKLNKELGNKISMAANMNNVGIIYRKLKDYKKAIHYYSEALELNMEIENQQGVATNLSNLGAVYEELEDYQSAISNYERALDLNREIDNKQGISFRLENLGSVYFRLKEYQKSKAYYEEAILISEKIGSKKLLANGLDNLGRISAELKDYKEAISYYKKSIQLAEEIGIEQQSVITHEKLADCYSQIGDYKKAFEAHKVYSKLKDFVLDQAQEVNSIQSKYDSEGKDLEIETLKTNNKELQLFANKATHELKEPIRMIGSFSSLLKRKHAGLLNKEGEEFLEIIYDGAKRMDDLINNLFNYSKLNSDQNQDAELVDLNKVLGQALKNLTLRIEETSADIQAEVLPTIEGVATNLIQVFQNLISNSLKFKTDKDPVIRISTVEEGDHYVVSVKDNGIGISEEHHDQVFEIFNRLHSQIDYEGTGVGLSIVKKVVQQLGGDIWIDNIASEQGTTFSFKIPK